jgi:hypothetical protein
MSKIYSHTVLPGQNLIDIAMQYYGSAEAVVELCIDNQLDIGTAIQPGLVLVVNEAYVVNKRLVQYYKDNQIIVASE